MKLLSVIAAIGMAGSFAGAATIYTNDFSANSTGFTTGGGTWTLGGGTYFQDTTPGNNQSYATVSAGSALGGSTNQSFSISTTFTVTDTATSYSVGFAILANNSNLASATYLLADISGAGAMRFRGFTNGGAAPADFGTSTGTLTSLAAGQVTLTLVGQYNGSNLDLTMTAVQGSSTKTLTGSVAATAYTGNNFGLRDRSNTDADPATIQFDRFTLESVVPEPSSALLVAGSMLAAVVRRRRI